MRLLAIGAAGLLLGTALLGAASAAGPSARDEALLHSILAGMKTDLVSVRLGEPKKAWLGSATPTSWKYLYVRPATTQGPGEIADEWYANLIAGAYEAQCGRRTADCLAGFGLDGVGGSRVQASRTPPTATSSRTIARELTTRFARHGLRVTAISFQRPWGFAPVVTVTSRHPQRAVTAFYKAALLLRLPIEGFLVRMVDARGRLFLIDGGSFRTKQGAGWTRPGLRVPDEKTALAP